MKTYCRNRLKVALTVLNFSLLFAVAASAQAPTSIAGKTFGMEVTNGTSPFASSGYFLFLPANSPANSYQMIGFGGVISSSGTYSYSAGTINLADSLAGSVYGVFTFNTAISGSDSVLGLTYGGSQSGDFVMFTNPVPTSISGQNFYVNVQGGSGQLASSGAFILTTANSGNAYTVTAISSGEINDSGTYSYSKLNASCGGIQLTDSQGVGTAYVAFTNSVSGGYYLTSLYGYQVGYLTLLNAQAPASIAGNTFIAAVTSGTPPQFAASGYFLFLPTNSTGYRVIGIAGVTNSTGTYSYSTNGAAGTINFSDSVNGSIKGSFFYFTSLLGSYALASGASGQYTETGDFAMLTNPVPNSITGQCFYITVTNGGAPFASSGTFTLTTAATGNTYKIKASSGNVTNSTGTYSYSKLNASCGGIQLTDSVAGVSTAYVALSNSVSGGYVLTQPSSGGYQIGFVSILPTLGIVHQSNNIVLTWPTNAVGFTLEYATNLPATNWTTNSSSFYIVNGQYTVTNTVSNRTKFYRLLEP
jgi:hypothetical protein